MSRSASSTATSATSRSSPRLAESELETAIALAHELQAMGRRFADSTLLALSALGEGRALVKQGEVSRGLALLDEAMLAAVSESMDPSWAGNIYCNVIDRLPRAGRLSAGPAVDTRRPRAGCDHACPPLVPFTGICRVHRAQILQLQRRLGARLSARRRGSGGLSWPASTWARVAEAHYQVGRGPPAAWATWPRAEAAYRQAHRLGPRSPARALRCCVLPRAARTRRRLAAIQAALAGARRQPAGPGPPAAPPRSTIALATGDVEHGPPGLRRDSSEIAAVYGSSGLRGRRRCRRADAVLLAEGHDRRRPLPDARGPPAAPGRRSNAPYEAARIRLLLATRLHRAGRPRRG